MNTYGFNVVEHTFIGCSNLSHHKRLKQFQCTLIKELNNLLLLTRNSVYRMHNFTKSDMGNLITVIAND